MSENFRAQMQNIGWTFILSKFSGKFGIFITQRPNPFLLKLRSVCRKVATDYPAHVLSHNAAVKQVASAPTDVVLVAI